MPSPNKENFFLSINKDLKADENFYKKIYGYSVTASAFPAKVANKLIEVGRKEVIQGYNQWLQGYLAKNKENMKEAAAWLRKEFDKEYEKRRREKEIEENERKYRFVGLPQDW